MSHSCRRPLRRQRPNRYSVVPKPPEGGFFNAGERRAQDQKVSKIEPDPALNRRAYHVGLPHLYRLLMLHGPGPNWVMSRAPPSMARFFINMTICICCIIGSVIPQNLCRGVTPIRNMTMSHAPSLARYPKRIDSAPNRAMSPE